MSLRRTSDVMLESVKVDVPADLHFDNWTFRRQPPELLRNGARVRLQEQPLQILDELLGRPGDLVTREHLIARLWPKRIVEFDAGLNAAIRRLRAVLGDEAETPRYIETVPRKGYRFIGTLRPPGIAEAAALPSLMPAQPSPLSRRVGVKARLAFVLAAVVTLGALSVFGIMQWRVSSAPDAGNIPASNEPLRRAQFFAQRRAPGDLTRAMQEYERASSLDPSSARAWAGLASVAWLQIGEGEESRDAGLRKVLAAAQKALDLDPRLAEAHLRMALYLKATGNVGGAREHMARAAALEPNDPLLLAILASDAANEARWEEAIVLQRRASAADPLSSVAAENLASYLFLAGRIEEAKLAAARVLELDPTFPETIRVFTQILEGRHEEALHTAETWPEGDARDEALALIYHGLGRSAESDESLGKLIATRNWKQPILVAEVYAFRGDNEAAFEWLQRSRAQLNMSRLLYASPFFKPLHGDVRWAQVTQKK